MVLAGPLALLLAPVALPPLILVFVQARNGTRVLRGHQAATLPLFMSACIGSVCLVLGAVVGLPGPTRQPPPLAEVPSDVQAGVSALVAAACIQAVAAGLLWPTARRLLRPSLDRVVGSALVVLAVAQVVALTVATRSG